MLNRRLSLIALLSVALHLVDVFVAAGHQHVHTSADSCAAACHAHSHAGHDHSHVHDHGHAHHGARGCGHHHHHDAVATQPTERDCSTPSHSHDDCAICRHLALTPALVSPEAVNLTPTGNESVRGEVATLLPPLRTVECRSRAPPTDRA